MDGTESERSSTHSSLTNREGPPKVYEEIIVGLEADVRKHIRIEQQLKLHIESIESRLDELELENEKLINDREIFDSRLQEIENKNMRIITELEKECKKLKFDKKEAESKHLIETSTIQDKLTKEKDELIRTIQKL
jgi:hypothetical protein